MFLKNGKWIWFRPYFKRKLGLFAVVVVDIELIIISGMMVLSFSVNLLMLAHYCSKVKKKKYTDVSSRFFILSGTDIYAILFVSYFKIKYVIPINNTTISICQSIDKEACSSVECSKQLRPTTKDHGVWVFFYPAFLIWRLLNAGKYKFIHRNILVICFWIFSTRMQ